MNRTRAGKILRRNRLGQPMSVSEVRAARNLFGGGIPLRAQRRKAARQQQVA